MNIFFTFFLDEKSKKSFSKYKIVPATVNTLINPLRIALIFLCRKITVRISALATGSDPRVEYETRAAGVAIGKFVRCFWDKNIQA
ncbi:hypothetical protein FLSI110296_10595 [Flavobacterium sinopsychrotolerans]|uniref:Uncharacterized protein n=1 Tax=Flavobacterium sinopsychrotolerans TaxID=604089 RepID=A0A1H8LYE5_9FLAO|nr:hypothetical protein SAMN04487942_1738 [Flavobacterium sinopsychrotolerans]